MAATRPRSTRPRAVDGTFASGPEGVSSAHGERVVETSREREPAPPQAVASGCGCGVQREPPDRTEAGLRTLPIVWQRLVTEGMTCPRCAGTQTEVERAVSVLAEVLRPLAIAPTLETRAIDRSDFAAAPEESNRIFVAGRPLEEWIGASTSASECCSVCGANQCRTVDVDGSVFETVPAALIVKAGLIAAASFVDT